MPRILRPAGCQQNNAPGSVLTLGMRRKSFSSETWSLFVSTNVLVERTLHYRFVPGWVPDLRCQPVQTQRLRRRPQSQPQCRSWRPRTSCGSGRLSGESDAAVLDARAATADRHFGFWHQRGCDAQHPPCATTATDATFITLVAGATPAWALEAAPRTSTRFPTLGARSVPETSTTSCVVWSCTRKWPFL